MLKNETEIRFWNYTSACLKRHSIFPEMDTNATESVKCSSHAVTPLVSQNTFTILDIVINISLESPLALFGCVSNVINIAVYLKMGVAETTTMALSTIDLLGCAATFITVVCFNPFTLGWTLPSGAKLAEIAFGAFIVVYPSLNCGA